MEKVRRESDAIFGVGGSSLENRCVDQESRGWAIRDISMRYSVYLLATDIPDHRPKNIAFPLMEVSRVVDGGIESGDRIHLKSCLR
jgi:hypothetical protein